MGKIIIGLKVGALGNINDNNKDTTQNSNTGAKLPSSNIEEQNSQNNRTVVSKDSLTAPEGNVSGSTGTNSTKDKGDPVNMASGAFVYTDNDYILSEMSYDFKLIRRYSSIENKVNRRSIGNKWSLSVDTFISRCGEDTIVTLPEGKTIEYRFLNGFYTDRRGENKKYTLIRPEEKFIFCDNEKKHKYIYDKNGKIEEISDRNGNKTVFRYCEYGIKEVELSTGIKLTFTWEAMNVSKIEDSTGRTVEYYYDKNLLSKVVRCDGTELSYTYDEDGNLTTVTDGNRRTYLTNEYDKKGRVIKQKLTDGSIYTFVYDDKNRTNTYIDEINDVTIKYTYDEKMDIVKVSYEDGTSEEIKMNEKGFIEEEIDRNKAVTRYKYDEYGNIIYKEEPSGLITNFIYDENNLAKITDNNGRYEEYCYDNYGNIETKKIKTGTGTDKTDRFLVYSYTYDDNGRLTAISENGELKEEYTYKEKNNRPSYIRKSNGEVINIKYDECLRVNEVTTEEGTEKYSYTPYNKTERYENREGEVTSYYYDDSWRLIKKVSGANNQTYTLNDNGEKYTYDDMDRLTGTEDETGRTVTYILNTNGDITEEILSGKTAVKYDYDKDFNVIRKHIFAEDEIFTERYFYNPCGEMIKKVTAECYDKEADDGDGYKYVRDKAGRIISVSDPYGYVTDMYTYDKNGNVLIHKHSFKKDNEDFNEYIKNTEDAGDIYKYDCRNKMTEKRQLLEISQEGKIYHAVTRYTYNEKEELIKEYVYLNKCESGKEPSGEVRTVTRGYDEEGRVISVSDNSGAEITYIYNKSGKVLQEKKKAEENRYEITEYAYDKCGRPVSKIQKEICIEECSITENTPGSNNETSVDKTSTVRRNRFVTLKEVQNKTREPEKKEKNISETEIKYNESGRVSEIIYPEGRVDKIWYDEAGRRIKVCVHTDGNTTKNEKSTLPFEISYKYDIFGYLSEKNENGMIVTYRNDIQGRCVEQTASDGGKSTYRYDSKGNIVRYVSAKENAENKTEGTRYIYDRCKRLIKEISPYDVVVRETEYDLYGNILNETLADGENIRYVYDLCGRRIIAETKEGIREEYSYDACGNVTANATGKEITRYESDSWGRVTTVKAPEGVNEHYEYDHKGNIVKSTDGAGHTTGYRSNIYGKLESIVYADGISETFTYNSEGKLTEHTKRSGKKVRYSYDGLGNLLTRQGENDLYEYTYDCSGRLETAKSMGITYNYFYDICGRLQEKKACGRSLVRYTYDLNGNVETLRDVTGKETKYTYDLLNRTKTIEENGHILASYEYTKGGKVSRIICGDIETSYGYDTAGNRTEILVTVGNETLCDTKYRYDDRGNCIEKTTTGCYGKENKVLSSMDNISIDYTYDGLNRLTSEERKNSQNYTEYTYEYDKAGNRSDHYATTGIINADGTLSGIEEKRNIKYTYNNLNQLQNVNDINAGSETAYEYDLDGNLTSDKKGMYSYDDFEHMSSAKLTNGDTFICRYDAEGLRYETEENGRLIQYIYRNRDVIAEESEDLGTTRYILGNGRLIASDSENARTYYHYVSDNIGSINYVLDTTLHNNEEKREEVIQNIEDRIKCYYEYDAFGNIVESEEEIRNIFKYTGEQYDSQTGLYYLKARYYNPVIGRFTQKDSYLGDGLNLYTYVKNNPVRYVDPSGHCSKDNGVESGSKPIGATYEGTIYRSVDSRYDPLEMSQYTINSNHRYTESGVPGLYFSSGEKIVKAELGNYDVFDFSNRTMYSYDVRLTNMLDVSNPSVRSQLGISLESIVGESYDVTHAIGQYAYSNGYNGIIAPSARADGGINIILFNAKGVK